MNCDYIRYQEGTCLIHEYLAEIIQMKFIIKHNGLALMHSAVC